MIGPRSTIERYDLHGIILEVEHLADLVAPGVRERLRRYRTQASHAADLRIRTRALEDEFRAHPPLSAEARTVYDLPFGAVRYCPASDGLVVTHGAHVQATCHAEEGRAEIAASRTSAEAPWLASRPVLTLCLYELMRRRGCFAVHAAALAVDGIGVVIPGVRGAGKSTLAIALLRGGFQLLGDDTCFIRQSGDDLGILAFSDDIGMTDASLEFFPELRALRGQPRLAGAAKHQLVPERHYDVQWLARSTPGLLVLPAIGRTTRSRLEALDPAAALLELVPNVLMTERRCTAAHLAALGALVARSACYRLHTGRDFADIPLMLQDLVAKARAA